MQTETNNNKFKFIQRLRYDTVNSCQAAKESNLGNYRLRYSVSSTVNGFRI